MTKGKLMWKGVVIALAGILATACFVQAPAGTVFASEPVWPIEGDCTACHVKEAIELNEESTAQTGKAAEDADAKPEERGDGFLAIHGAFDCYTCHADEKLAELHDGVTADSKMPKKLKKTEVDEEFCLTCHESYEKLAQKTADSQALVDQKGTVVNPHALPEVADHDPIACIDCHTVHKDAEKPVQEKAKAKCLSCHHEDVFECGTCHEG